MAIDIDCGPLVRILKEAALHAQRAGLDEVLACERRLFHLTFALDHRREATRMFAEKRPLAYWDR